PRSLHAALPICNDYRRHGFCYQADRNPASKRKCQPWHRCIVVVVAQEHSDDIVLGSDGCEYQRDDCKVLDDSRYIVRIDHQLVALLQVRPQSEEERKQQVNNADCYRYLQYLDYLVK